MSAATTNQERKARAIAPALYRRAMTVEDLRALPYASHNRSEPTMRAFARLAFTEAGISAQEPHGGVSNTWAKAAALLQWMEDHPTDPRTPARDRLDDRPRWVLAHAPEPPQPAPRPSELELDDVDPDNDEQLPTHCTARGCGLPLDPAVTWNPVGKPFDTHPSCIKDTAPPPGWRQRLRQEGAAGRRG